MPGGQHVHFAVTEIRGDWKWQADTRPTCSNPISENSNRGPLCECKFSNPSNRYPATTCYPITITAFQNQVAVAVGSNTLSPLLGAH